MRQKKKSNQMVPHSFLLPQLLPEIAIEAGDNTLDSQESVLVQEGVIFEINQISLLLSFCVCGLFSG